VSAFKNQIGLHGELNERKKLPPGKKQQKSQNSLFGIIYGYRENSYESKIFRVKRFSVKVLLYFIENSIQMSHSYSFELKKIQKGGRSGLTALSKRK